MRKQGTPVKEKKDWPVAMGGGVDPEMAAR